MKNKKIFYLLLFLLLAVVAFTLTGCDVYNTTSEVMGCCLMPPIIVTLPIILLLRR
ncbi:MAG: hypothetical protein IMY76_08870 [Chloroflexi bacterium]|nr:hypothetical protein [Chloroflexota bacterium]